MFINLFHNRDLHHWHLIYNYETNEVVGEPVRVKMSSDPSTKLYTTKLNFPYKNFYDSTRKKVYCFYRQG